MLFSVRLAELLRQHSKDSELIVMTLPTPRTQVQSFLSNHTVLVALWHTVQQNTVQYSLITDGLHLFFSFKTNVYKEKEMQFLMPQHM